MQHSDTYNDCDSNEPDWIDKGGLRGGGIDWFVPIAVVFAIAITLAGMWAMKNFCV